MRLSPKPGAQAARLFYFGAKRITPVFIVGYDARVRPSTKARANAPSASPAQRHLMHVERTLEHERDNIGGALRLDRARLAHFLQPRCMMIPKLPDARMHAAKRLAATYRYVLGIC